MLKICIKYPLAVPIPILFNPAEVAISYDARF